MEIRNSEEGWEFAGIDPFILELLRALPSCATTEDDAARKRLFSAPTGGADADADADADWREYVEPELAALFQSHLDIVSGDLAAITETEEGALLRIPAAHARAWIHTFNQARLALGARHDVTEDDTSGRRDVFGDKEPDAQKAFALMQIDFYAWLLSLLLSRTEL